MDPQQFIVPPGLTIAPEDDPYGPYVALSRRQWADLADTIPWTLDSDTLARLRGLGDPTDHAEVLEVYHPLTQLLNLYWERTNALFSSSHDFLGLNDKQVPFVIGVAGSVAVGKSTTARLLQELLARGPRRPKVELITTDGFLYPNHLLEAMGIAHRKGFPESYDRAALLQFVIDVKSGKSDVTAPVYSHLIYDIVPDEFTVVKRPDILIVEGLNVLQPASMQHPLAVSDLFDFSIYVDAPEATIKTWYLERFVYLKNTAFQSGDSYFNKYKGLSDSEALSVASDTWDRVNLKNLVENILPTRERANLIIHKSADHSIDRLLLRQA